MSYTNGSLTCDACKSAIEVEVCDPVDYGDRPTSVVRGGVECDCGKAYCTTCAALTVRDGCCIDCLALPPLTPDEASALAACIVYRDSAEGLKLPGLSRVARLALMKICPHDEKARAHYAGLQGSVCATCGLVFSAEPIASVA